MSEADQNTWKHEASQLAISAIAQTEHAADRTVQSAEETMTNSAPHSISKAETDTSDSIRSLMKFAGSTHDLQGCFNGLVEGVVRTNLRLAQEVFLVDSPRAFFELQQRFILDYFETFQRRIAALVRASSREASTGH